MNNLTKSLFCILFSVSVAVLFTGCNPNYDMPGMFNGSSERADKRFEESMAYNQQHGYAHLIVPEDYRIYACTDTHVDSTTYNWETFVKLYKSDPACPFAIHLGDLINANNNFERFFKAAAVVPEGYVQGKDTCFYTLGNHDIYFNQWPAFKSYVHTSTYWFDTRTADGKLLDLFICLDSGEGTLGVEPLKWLNNTLEEKSEEGYRHIIVFTHTHVFKQDDSQGHTSNYSMEETYDITAILSKYHVDMYWSGHDHSREITHYGGVTYIVVDALDDPVETPFYMVADMSKAIHYDFIALEKKKL